MRWPLFLLTSYSSFSILNAQCPQIVWQDEFDGNTLDENKWTHQIGDGCDIDLCGWGNNELQYYRAENTVVSNGTLKITAKRESFENRSYTSSRINSKDLGDWTYGRFEARIKLPTGKGLWPAFWMLSTEEPYGTWPQSGEIDIMEIIGSEPSTSHGTIHFGQLPNNRSAGESYTLNQGSFNDGFHIFAIEWEPAVIRWYVDDHHFSTKTSIVTGGSRWPFDHDFHFLLNVAVGGNWPGSPNANTSFPQIMEVDYVRVYDGNFPSISGAQQVENQARGSTYRINNLKNDTAVDWMLPEGATIASQSGAEAIINWGQSGGTLSAIFDNGCGRDTVRLDVEVAPALVREMSLENFDSEAEITFTSATGNLMDNVSNPIKNELNNSDLCGQYDRNSTELFDVLFYDTNIFDDVTTFLNGEKTFYLDVLTDAPVNTLILLQLENDQRAQDTNYPIGRNSRFEARTAAQDEWQRLKFELLDRPDPNTSPRSIDRITFLFGSNTNLGSRFYFDNFDVYGPQETVSNAELESSGALRYFPNPVDDLLEVEFQGGAASGRMDIYDIRGTLLYSAQCGESKINHQIDISHLPSGLHMLLWNHPNGAQSIIKFLKS